MTYQDIQAAEVLDDALDEAHAIDGLGDIGLDGQDFAARRRGDLLRHLAGGALMGVGGVLAMGCTIGQGLSGLSTLSATALLATLAILAGAAWALRFLETGRLLPRMADVRRPRPGAGASARGTPWRAAARGDIS